MLPILSLELVTPWGDDSCCCCGTLPSFSGINALAVGDMDPGLVVNDLRDSIGLSELAGLLAALLLYATLVGDPELGGMLSPFKNCPGQGGRCTTDRVPAR